MASVQSPAALASEVAETIGANRNSRLRRWLWRLGVLAVVVVGAVGITLWRSTRDDVVAQTFVTVPVHRADLRATVTGTGSVKARDQVEVGAEISGTVKAVYVDFNDHVTAGQVLCEIESSQQRAAVAQSRAQLRAREAELESLLASAQEAKLAEARTRALFADHLISGQTLEAAVASLVRANAAVSSGRAQIALAREALASAMITLQKTEIRAPIEGVLLSRSVEPGQTVAAAFATPVLFILAKDLTKMEVEVDIDEADVGAIATSQPATFTVDAFPGRRFAATIRSIRNISTIIDNVVTYRAILAVANDDLALRPGMTATVTIVTAARTNALLVPNAALRFTPPSALQRTGPNMSRMFGGRAGSGSARPAPAAPTGPVVWLLQDRQPVAVGVRAGLSDGEWTEVLDAKLEPGTEVIVDVITSGG